MFIKLEELNRKTCTVQRVRFVKNVSRRSKEANVWVAGTNPVIEVVLHTFPWNSSRTRKSIWDGGGGCYGYCSNGHHKIFIKDERLYTIVKSETREFENSWLLNHVMRNVFKAQK